jgi:poly-beta-1,6-N-acetyl-D-glucosamine synthase
MLAKCVSRLIQRPFVTGSCALMYGFVTGYTKGIAQVDDPRMTRYLRREQIRKLLGKKTVWN